MIVDLPRRWRWGVAGVCAVVAVLALVFVYSTRQAEREGVKVTREAPASMPVPWAPASPASAAPAVEEEAAAPGVDQVEVCRLGWVAVDAEGHPDESRLLGRITPTVEGVLARMRAEGGEMGRAVAGLLDPAGDPASALDALAQTALVTTDPAVYALAFQRCMSVQEGPCRMLSTARWIQLDPGNAAPWLFVLADATQRGDKSEVQEALHQIAQSKVNQSGYLSFLRSVMAALPDDEDSLFASEAMVTAATGFDAATPFPSYSAVVSACGPEALRDSNRAQTCDAVAALLGEHSDTMIGQMIGARIGSRVGWPADRVDRIRGAYSLWSTHHQKTFEQAYGSIDMGCGTIRRRLDLFRDQADHGEIGGLRRWLEESGTTPEEVLREGRAVAARRAEQER